MPLQVLAYIHFKREIANHLYLTDGSHAPHLAEEKETAAAALAADQAKHGHEQARPRCVRGHRGVDPHGARLVRSAPPPSPSPASRLLFRSPFLRRGFLQPDDADGGCVRHSLAARAARTACSWPPSISGGRRHRRRSKLGTLVGNVQYTTMKLPVRRKVPKPSQSATDSVFIDIYIHLYTYIEFITYNNNEESSFYLWIPSLAAAYVLGGFSSYPQVSTLSISLMPDASRISNAGM